MYYKRPIGAVNLVTDEMKNDIKQLISTTTPTNVISNVEKFYKETGSCVAIFYLGPRVVL